MKILIVCRYKYQFEHHITPFVTEQAEAIAALGNQVEYFTIKGKGLLAYFTSISALKKKIKTYQPDIIHAHYGLSGLTAVLAARKTPVVITWHNGETLSFSANLLSSLAAMRAEHIIYVAQHIYDLAYYKAKNYTILPCGVTLEECTITDYEQARQLLNFTPNKKYILFGGAFSNLRKNYPLLQQAVELTGRTDIEVLEMKGLSRQEIALRMSACDLFALPTKSEGSPQALKEAMAANCPIMATDVADIKYLLGDMAGHYICSFNPQEVAQTLHQALAFNARTEGRQRILALGLTNQQVAEKVSDIYQSVLGR